MTTPDRIFLSPPDVGAEERRMLLEAFDSNWIAPVGPALDAFEEELAEVAGCGHGAALSSGTAALHVALRLLGVGAGDEVIVPSLTFVASAAAATYVGARPVFIDVDPVTWTIDPDLLHRELATRAKHGRLPAAVITVDLYGQCADYEPLLASCATFGVPVVEDAAEALGATYKGRPAGSFGSMAVFSFNGNKIITTSGGGMVVSDDAELVARARYLAAQARQPAAHYQHTEIGYNYRLSNLLAALGRAQLKTLPERIDRRRAINARYRRELDHLPGVAFPPEAPYGTSTCWLTCLTLDADRAGVTRDELCQVLGAEAIEGRPVWKPLHLQPAFAGADTVGGEVSEGLFATGLCLPSGSNLADADQDRVIATLVAAWGGRR